MLRREQRCGLAGFYGDVASLCGLGKGRPFKIRHTTASPTKTYPGPFAMAEPGFFCWSALRRRSSLSHHRQIRRIRLSLLLPHLPQLFRAPCQFGQTVKQGMDGCHVLLIRMRDTVSPHPFYLILVRHRRKLLAIQATRQPRAIEGRHEASRPGQEKVVQGDQLSRHKGPAFEVVGAFMRAGPCERSGSADCCCSAASAGVAVRTTTTSNPICKRLILPSMWGDGN